MFNINLLHDHKKKQKLTFKYFTTNLKNSTSTIICDLKK